MKISNKLQACIGMVISIFLIAIVFQRVDAVSVGEVLRQTSIFWVLVALLFYWVEILIRILRWKHIMFSADNVIRYSSVRNSFFIGAAINNIFPFRLGDLMRAHLVGIQRSISRYSLVGTIVLEKLIDVTAVLLLTFFGALAVLSHLGVMSKVFFAFLICCVIIAILGGLYLLLKNRILSNKFMVYFQKRVGHFKKGFGILLKPKIFSLVLFETMLIWSFNTLAIWALIKSLGVSLSVSEVLLLEGVSALAAVIPSAPAGIGTTQYAYLLTFGMMHLDNSVGVAASLLVQGVLLGSITLVGVLIFIFDTKSRHALRRIRHE